MQPIASGFPGLLTTELPDQLPPIHLEPDRQVNSEDHELRLKGPGERQVSRELGMGQIKPPGYGPQVLAHPLARAHLGVTRFLTRQLGGGKDLVGPSGPSPSRVLVLPGHRCCPASPRAPGCSWSRGAQCPPPWRGSRAVFAGTDNP